VSLFARLRGLVSRRVIEAELDEELQFHLEREIAANLARGLPPEEARRLALREFGGVLQTAERVRDVRTLGLRMLTVSSFSRRRSRVTSAPACRPKTSTR
jgi:hypothetical protein